MLRIAFKVKYTSVLCNCSGMSASFNVAQAISTGIQSAGSLYSELKYRLENVTQYYFCIKVNCLQNI